MHVTIRDGDHIDSPYLYQSNLATGQLSQPMPAIVTQSDTLSVQLKNNYYTKQEEFYFELYSGLPGNYITDSLPGISLLSQLHMTS